MLYNFLNSPGHDSYTNLWKFLSFYAKNNDIHDIILVNRTNHIIFSLDNSLTQLNDYELMFVKECIHNNKILISDLHFNNTQKLLHISVFAPLVIHKNIDPSLCIIAITDEKNFFVHLLSQWSSLEDSLETLLLQKRSNQICSINTHNDTIKITTIDKDKLSKNNIFYHFTHGKQGLLLRCDIYYNTRVLSYSTVIDNLSWMVITKINYYNLFHQW